MPEDLGNVLILYLEPTPYVAGLVDQLRCVWRGRLVVCYVASDLSQSWGLEVHGNDVLILPAQRWHAISVIWRYFRSGRFQLVHLAGWGHPVLLATLVLARLYGIPVAVESDTPTTKAILEWRTRLRRFGHPFLFKIPSVFLPGGSRQAAYLQHYGVDDGRIRIAQMTVDVDAIRAHVAGVDPLRRRAVRQLFGIASDATLFLYVGRLEKHKGLNTLIAAFRRVSSVRSGLALQLVGDGSQRGALEHAARDCPGLHLAGRLAGLELLDAYAAADVFVLPSLFEPWGLVVNEAMAAGLPVIASDRVGCIDDLVRPEETGLVVEAERSDVLADAMERLVHDAGLRARLGAAASRLISSWTLENEAHNVTAAWQSVMVES